MMVLAIGGNNCTQVSETLLDAFHTTSAPQVGETLLMSSVLSHRVVRLHGHGGTYCTHVSETLVASSMLSHRVMLLHIGELSAFTSVNPCLMSSTLRHHVIVLVIGGTYCTKVNETLLDVIHTKTSCDGGDHLGNLVH